MKLLISILAPEACETMGKICAELNVPLLLQLRARGTATRSMRELLGIESTERRVAFAVVGDKQAAEVIRAQRRQLYIDAPGCGVTVTVPIKSVGGGRTLAYLGGNEEKKAPELNFDCELIYAVAAEGHSDEVMDAARSAGARGGTVLHAKGTWIEGAEKFFGVSLAREREIVMIVVSAARKAAVMRGILEKAGPSTETEAIVFSLPVSDTAGFAVAGDE